MKQQQCCRHSFSVFCRAACRPVVARKHTFRRICIQWFLAILIFGRMPKITRWFRALTFEDVSARFSGKRPNRTPTCGTLLEFVWPSFCGSAQQAIFHSDFHRGENYSCLLLNTVQPLSIGGISPRLSSTPLLLLRLFTSAPVSTHFWPESYVTWTFDLEFSSPSKPSEESPFRTTPNTVWVDQIRFRNLHKLSKTSFVGILPSTPQ